jgi:UDP-N-acetyl-D-mannosaminuronate dehydrogenase
MIRVGILGYGEIGESIEKLYLGREFDLAICDPSKNKFDDLTDVSILNVCIPYDETFVNTIVATIEDTNPSLVIIHSTVKPGTTGWIKDLLSLSVDTGVVYSPVRGNHPNLYFSLKTFVKYIGANDIDSYDLAAAHFAELSITSEWIGDTKTAELAKLLCTTYYGICIAWHEEMKSICELHKVPFEAAVTKWNTSYNEGYKQLGMDAVVRPVLYPPGERIGGHCVIPNANILKEVVDSPFVDLVLQFK